MKNNGYNIRYRLGAHHMMSKSDFMIQKAIACSPEHNVRMSEIKATLLHFMREERPIPGH
jgi:hypothetical protein